MPRHEVAETGDWESEAGAAAVDGTLAAVADCRRMEAVVVVVVMVVEVLGCAPKIASVTVNVIVTGYCASPFWVASAISNCCKVSVSVGLRHSSGCGCDSYFHLGCGC